jgi:phosphate transport system protein
VGDSASSERAGVLEARTDHQLRMIHDQCLSLITLQAPVARDARLVTGVLDAIVDLELIGDYALEIVTISGSMERRPPNPIMAQILEIASRAREILSVAIDGWRSEEADRGLSVRPRAAAIRGDCQTFYGKLAQLTSAPGGAMPYVNLMLVCRHLERISRHAACVAEQAASAASMRSSQ